MSEAIQDKLKSILRGTTESAAVGKLTKNNVSLVDDETDG